jgi:hypothetical protein
MSGNPSMPTASIQYNEDEKLAMARAAAGLLARWNVLGETANRLLDGDERTERAAALLTMHAALRRVFWDCDRAARWIGSANDAFNGSSALDLMLAEGLAGMERVRAYVDAEIAS